MWKTLTTEKLYLCCSWLCYRPQCHQTSHFVRAHSAIQWCIIVKAARPLSASGLAHPLFPSFLLSLCLQYRVYCKNHIPTPPNFYYSEIKSNKIRAYILFWITPPLFSAIPPLFHSKVPLPCCCYPCCCRGDWWCYYSDSGPSERVVNDRVGRVQQCRMSSD